MDVPAVAAGPWIALGAVLGMLLLLAAGALALRLRTRVPPGRADAAPPAGQPRDDLADFLARPPGTPGAPERSGHGWAVLTPAEPPARREEPVPVPGTRPGTALAALAVVALLLVGVAAALAAAARSPEPVPAAGPTTAPAGPPSPAGEEEVTARLAFGGVVLEEHAVGATVAHPELELTSDDGRTVARLRLPAANCLAAAAPPQPGDPSCRATRTEYAELATPDLDVVRDGDELTVSGRFATELRPPGGTPEATGRSYDVAVTVSDDGRSSTEGRLQWDGELVPVR